MIFKALRDCLRGSPNTENRLSVFVRFYSDAKSNTSFRLHQIFIKKSCLVVHLNTLFFQTDTRISPCGSPRIKGNQSLSVVERINITGHGLDGHRLPVRWGEHL